MSKYTLDTTRRQIELMDENKIEVRVLTEGATVQVFLLDDPWGEATLGDPFYWTGLKDIPRIGLQSDMENTEVEVA